jgi:DNA-directed RNA polymerase specialized sigma24 family protein
MQAHRLPTTNWTMILRAATARPDRDEQLGLYLPAIRWYLSRVRGLSRDDADEVVQEFVARKFVVSNLFAAVSKGKGKFRTYLLRALDNFLVDRQRAASRDRAFGVQECRSGLGDAAVAGDGPAWRFERVWGQTVMTATVARVHAHCLAQGRADVWRVFEARLVAPAADGARPVPYEALAAELGLKTPMQAANLLVTGKRLFERELQGVIRVYAGEGADIGEEVADLHRIFSRRAESANVNR